MVLEGECLDAARLPPGNPSAQLVDAVPAHTLFQRQDVGEARCPIGACRTADVAARDVRRTPDTIRVLFEAHPTGDPEAWLRTEGRENPLEEVGPEGDVCVELHDHISAERERVDARVKRAYNGSASRRQVVL